MANAIKVGSLVRLETCWRVMASYNQPQVDHIVGRVLEAYDHICYTFLVIIDANGVKWSACPPQSQVVLLDPLEALAYEVAQCSKEC